MASTNKFAFQAPNPQALDPSTLEQIYAQGATRRLGPAFNLVAQGLARNDRQDSANAYLASIGDLNRRAQEAGRMQLEHEKLLEFVKLGSDLVGKDMTFTGTPLAQFALTMGQGGSADLLQALMQTGALNNAARRTEQVGSGASKLMAEGFRPPSGLTVDQLPFAPLTQGTPTSVMAANAGNPSVRPQLVVKRDANTGTVVEETRVSLDPSTVQNIPSTPGQLATQNAQSAHSAEAVSSIGQEGGKFVDALYKARIPIARGAIFKRDSGNVDGRLVEDFPVVVLPNGTAYGFVDGSVKRLQTPSTAKK